MGCLPVRGTRGSRDTWPTPSPGALGESDHRCGQSRATPPPRWSHYRCRRLRSRSLRLSRPLYQSGWSWTQSGCLHQSLGGFLLHGEKNNFIEKVEHEGKNYCLLLCQHTTNDQQPPPPPPPNTAPTLFLLPVKNEAISAVCWFVCLSS